MVVSCGVCTEAHRRHSRPGCVALVFSHTTTAPCPLKGPACTCTVYRYGLWSIHSACRACKPLARPPDKGDGLVVHNVYAIHDAPRSEVLFQQAAQLRQLVCACALVIDVECAVVTLDGACATSAKPMGANTVIDLDAQPCAGTAAVSAYGIQSADTTWTCDGCHVGVHITLLGTAAATAASIECANTLCMRGHMHACKHPCFPASVQPCRVRQGLKVAACITCFQCTA